MSTRRTNNDTNTQLRRTLSRRLERDRNSTVSATTIAFVAPAATNSPQLVVNGTFATDTSSWTAVRNATLTVAAGYMRVARNGTNNPAATQTISGLVAGRTYLFSYDVLEQSASAGVGTIADAADSSTLATVSYVVDGSYSTTFVAPVSGSITVTVQASTSNLTDFSDFDNISVREVAAAITDSGNGLGIFPAGSRILVVGSPNNSRRLEVSASSAGQLTLRHNDLVTESAGPLITISTAE